MHSTPKTFLFSSLSRLIYSSFFCEIHLVLPHQQCLSPIAAPLPPRVSAFALPSISGSGSAHHGPLSPTGRGTSPNTTHPELSSTKMKFSGVRDPCSLLALQPASIILHYTNKTAWMGYERCQIPIQLEARCGIHGEGLPYCSGAYLSASIVNWVLSSAGQKPENSSSLPACHPNAASSLMASMQNGACIASEAFYIYLAG